MRGKLKDAPAALLSKGITPAHAGKTLYGCRRLGRNGDHPRACGENSFLTDTWTMRRGSPPRMRGKRGFREQVYEQNGITPAHAGKTYFAVLPWFVRGDHPRACGENEMIELRFAQIRGSPPRMRGKRIFVDPAARARGITPAHAGKTPEVLDGSGGIWDHPRACGENFIPYHAPYFVKGSPPRMRGKQPPTA